MRFILFRKPQHTVLVLLFLFFLTGCVETEVNNISAEVIEETLQTQEAEEAQVEEASNAAETDWGNLLSSMTQGGTLTCDPELNRAYLAVDDMLMILDDTGEFITTITITPDAENDPVSMRFLTVEDGRLYFISGSKLYSLDPAEHTGKATQYSNTRAGWGFVQDGLLYFSAAMDDTIQYQGLGSALPGSNVNIVAENVDTRTLQRCPVEDGLYYVSLQDSCLWYVSRDGTEYKQCTALPAFSPVASGTGEVYYIGEDDACYTLDNGDTSLFSGCAMLFAADGGLVWFCDADFNLWVWSEETGTASLVYDAPVSSFQKAGYWYSLYDMENMQTVYGILADDGTLLNMEIETYAAGS